MGPSVRPRESNIVTKLYMRLLPVQVSMVAMDNFIYIKDFNKR